MLCEFFLGSIVSDEKSAVTSFGFPLLTCETFFFFVFTMNVNYLHDFRCLIMMCLGMDFFIFILFRFAQFLNL